MYALAKISMMPSRMPPMNAPGIEPMPPNTAAVNALMPGMRAGGRHQGRVGGAEQHARDSRKARADGKGDGNGRVDVDAHQLGRALVLRHRTHRRADLALAGEQHQSDHDDNAGRDGQRCVTLEIWQLTAEQADRLAGNDRGKALRVGGPDQQRRILQEVAKRRWP